MKEITIKKLVNDINNICYNIDNYQNQNNIKLRKKKNGILISDAVLYRMFYSQNGITQQSIVSKLNFLNNTTFYRSSYESKESNISDDIYLDLFNRSKKAFYNLCSKNNMPNIISIDGTYINVSHNHSIKTCLNMGYFDVTNNCPINLQFCGLNSRNCEAKLLMEYIKKNNITNTIFIADRAYFVYELFLLLLETKNYYIIRIKHNSHLLDKKVEPKNKINNEATIKYIKSVSRIIENKYVHNKVICDKENNKLEVEIDETYYLLTNLPLKTYDDKTIYDTYKSRWKVETYFNYVKSNFTFSEIVLKNNDKINKINYSQLIITFIMKTIKNQVMKEFIEKLDKNKINDDNNFNINESNIITGIFDHLLIDIIKSTLTVEKLTRFINSYFIITNNKKDRHFPRTCKWPFKKWYIKTYAELYKYKKLFEVLYNNLPPEKLNKNLKTIISNIKKINII